MHNKLIVTLCTGVSQAAVQLTLGTLQLALTEFCREYNALVYAGTLSQQDNMMQFLQGYDYAGHICTNLPEHCDFGNSLVKIVGEADYESLINFFSDLCEPGSSN